MVAINATRVTASTLGAMTGLYGEEHGYFETLQGNVAPSGIVISAVSPPCLPYPLGCEPAVTIIPNFFLTGVLAIIFSLAGMIWAAVFVQRKNGGVVLILLSIAQVLVGGGLAPMFGGVLGGVAGTKINSPLTWWRTHLSVTSTTLLAKLWLWSLAIYLLWVPAEFIGGYSFSANNPILASLPSIPVPLVFIILAVLGGLAYDIQK